MIEKFDVKVAPMNREMKIHLYLPEGYAKSNKRYPVFYMYDGHNLFFDEDATYGTCWGIKDYLDKEEMEIIVVGMECDHSGNNRLKEYCPYSVDSYFAGWIEGCGDTFMEYVVQELKPYIDSTYRTLPEREYTGIGGSSMGGLMSLYSIIKYNDVFSKAACLSPSAMICQNELKKELEHKALDQNTRIYLDMGSEELGNRDFMIQAVDMMFRFNHMLSQKGVSCYPRLVVGGNHNEASWRSSLPVFMPYLWG
ncbi:MAG: alpha/beta hydrolase-fold protein [Bacillota bacterium]|nr:alpha/beta hydrolase-fold protein [Bacillota bacterium]